MRKFLLQRIANIEESNTATSLSILLEDKDFYVLACKLLKDVNQNNYEDKAKQLSRYANKRLI